MRMKGLNKMNKKDNMNMKLRTKRLNLMNKYWKNSQRMKI